MRTLLLVLFSMTLIQPINAKTWLIVNKQNKEILSMSNENDAQLPDSSYEKIVLDEDYWDIKLDENATLYKFKNNKFIKNIEKISNIEIEKEKAEEKNKEEKLITERMRKIARDQLIEEGVIKE